MNEKGSSVGVPAAPLPLDRNPIQTRRTRTLWKYVLLLGFLGFLLFMKFSHMNWKFPTMGDINRSASWMGLSETATQLEGPTDLIEFMQELERDFNDDSGYGGYCRKMGIAFPPEYLKHPQPPRRHAGYDIEKTDSQSQVFRFDPSSFESAALYIYGDFHKGNVLINQGDVENVEVNVTLLAKHKKNFEQVSLTSFDNNGRYVVEVKRTGPHYHKKHGHISIHTFITFPQELSCYKGLDIKARRAEIGGDVDLVFDRLKAGVGHGSIQFKSLRANELFLGALHGSVQGTYNLDKRFAAGVMRGDIDVCVNPKDNLNITTTVSVGSSTVRLLYLNKPGDDVQGQFLVTSLTGQPIVQADKPEDLHVTSFGYTFKKGYYKAEEGSNISAHSRHGPASIIFALKV
ncbi:hypothetical protein EC973_007329 [Apophysomyces ossiformis]|uniref:Adhesin domain-containing protein n=1 Tax=Apophysomyces ossiformis TaxID=679940 RepID=A0A8H7BY05_9FUNG|nr:hypothetical protein EC973_007329 [Apophysomyces ossiformis]